MMKIYTITENKYTEISTVKGSIRYELIDEQGEKRTVMAMAKLGITKKIKSVQPIYHRETPLVEALSKSSVDDKIWVDFSDFNKKHPRLIPVVNKNTHARQCLKEVKTNHSSSTLSTLSVDPARLSQLLFFASVGFLAFLAI